MSNMSYCRFENTLEDLVDCHEALGEEGTLSASEKKARKGLIELCKDIVNDFGDCEDEDE